MIEHSQEWCEEMKKTCDYCQHVNFAYCKDHEPWREIKSHRRWGGMNHESKCPFYLQLENKDVVVLMRYFACVQVDFIDDPDFKGYDMKCPDCKGFDLEIRKNY